VKGVVRGARRALGGDRGGCGWPVGVSVTEVGINHSLNLKQALSNGQLYGKIFQNVSYISDYSKDRDNPISAFNINPRQGITP
jgi:hypothetical protein